MPVNRRSPRRFGCSGCGCISSTAFRRTVGRFGVPEGRRRFSFVLSDRCGGLHATLASFCVLGFGFPFCLLQVSLRMLLTLLRRLVAFRNAKFVFQSVYTTVDVATEPLRTLESHMMHCSHG